MTIYLSDLQFYCHHGLYQEETVVGGKYVVYVELEIATPVTTIRSLTQTVNYVEAYEIIKNRMMRPTPLLETIVMELCDELLRLLPVINGVTIIIKKFALPITGFQGQTAVKFTKRK